MTFFALAAGVAEAHRQVAIAEEDCRVLGCQVEAVATCTSTLSALSESHQLPITGPKVASALGSHSTWSEHHHSRGTCLWPMTFAWSRQFPDTDQRSSSSAPSAASHGHGTKQQATTHSRGVCSSFSTAHTSSGHLSAVRTGSPSGRKKSRSLISCADLRLKKAQAVLCPSCAHSFVSRHAMSPTVFFVPIAPDLQVPPSLWRLRTSAGGVLTKSGRAGQRHA